MFITCIIKYPVGENKERASLLNIMFTEISDFISDCWETMFVQLLIDLWIKLTLSVTVIGLSLQFLNLFNADRYFCKLHQPDVLQSLQKQWHDQIWAKNAVIEP